ncbi:hypothetical protein CSB20_04935 [bacterium DOLZORAL124_64_63]|nr:MAG: hypothetical protein CSB20_04935 [bacterium DOLZORAL124_64_63]
MLRVCHFPHFRWRLGPGLVVLVLLAFLACSSSTDPGEGPEDLRFTFVPDLTVVDLVTSQQQQFSVRVEPTVDLSISWVLNDEAPLEAPDYVYDAALVGVDTLRAVFSYQGTTWDHTWYLDVSQSPVTAPGRVPGVTLEHGPEPASVRVSWQWIADSEFPITDYIVALDTDGPITMENWEQAREVGVLAHQANQVGYSLTFYEEESGLEAGRRTWFAVRGLDTAGQLSVLDTVPSIVVSSPWLVEGYVLDDALNPIRDVILDYGCPSCRVNTDAEGYYSFGPVPDVSVLTIETLSRNDPEPGDPFGAWYDFIWSGVTYAEGASYDIVLGRRFGLDADCDAHDHDFMTYLRFTTRTRQFTALRENYNLYRWENYPLSVYVQPGYVNEYGLDMSALAAEAVLFWNQAMGAEYLVLTPDPSAADVDVYFGNESIQYAGRAYITEPDDEDYALGDVIPEHARVYLWNQIADAQRLQETTMHEFGHVLGLVEHSACSGGGFIMSVNPSGMLDDGPVHAVHIDEKRAVRMIRNLRQGTDMSGFLVEDDTR